MNDNDLTFSDLTALVGEWMPLPDVAEQLDLSISRVHRLLEERELITVRNDDNVRVTPALFLDGDRVTKNLKGTIILLQDQELRDDEIIEWLFTEDETLPGRPIDRLREGQRGEVRRRAQSLAF
ncbi:hypothetical protein FHX50_000526 [Helcobacillus massiliensis]|uniref:DNA-binding protein n=2 Tax=Dermabacteraceae TaxID=85020 RepID=A0A839QRI1_9MICO|nr:hypothetical protein [Helcobacillus massiliensis]